LLLRQHRFLYHPPLLLWYQDCSHKDLVASRLVVVHIAVAVELVGHIDFEVGLRIVTEELHIVVEGLRIALVVLRTAAEDVDLEVARHIEAALLAFHILMTRP